VGRYGMAGRQQERVMEGMGTRQAGSAAGKVRAARNAPRAEAMLTIQHGRHVRHNVYNGSGTAMSRRRDAARRRLLT